jgi:hypothetical protein
MKIPHCSHFFYYTLQATTIMAVARQPGGRNPSLATPLLLLYEQTAHLFNYATTVAHEGGGRPLRGARMPPLVVACKINMISNKINSN